MQGSEQSALTEADACAGQDEPWSRHVVKEQRLLKGIYASPVRGSENGWQISENSFSHTSVFDAVLATYLRESRLR